MGTVEGARVGCFPSLMWVLPVHSGTGLIGALTRRWFVCPEVFLVEPVITPAVSILCQFNSVPIFLIIIIFLIFHLCGKMSGDLEKISGHWDTWDLVLGWGWG